MSNAEQSAEIYDVIRRNIKRFRKERKMTSAQLAEAVGLSHDFIRQIESEKTRYSFSVETLYKISVALDASMDELAGRARAPVQDCISEPVEAGDCAPESGA